MTFEEFESIVKVADVVGMKQVLESSPTEHAREMNTRIRLGQRISPDENSVVQYLGYFGGLNMGMDNYTAHQQKIIKRYYEHRDEIALQRLSELVTDLYLAEGKKRVTVWKNLTATLTKLNVPAARISHLQTQDDPKLLAALVTELSSS